MQTARQPQQVRRDVPIELVGQYAIRHDANRGQQQSEDGRIDHRQARPQRQRHGGVSAIT